MRYYGRCKCGNIRIEFESEIDPKNLPIRACQCSFCIKHGATTATDKSGSVTVQIFDRSKVNNYKFSTNTAEYLLCNQCGDYVGAILKFDRKKYSTINLRLFSSFSSLIQKATAVNYEHEAPDERLKRRVENWTPTKVKLSPART
jgi:hypothetical protein